MFLPLKKRGHWFGKSSSLCSGSFHLTETEFWWLNRMDIVTLSSAQRMADRQARTQISDLSCTGGKQPSVCLSFSFVSKRKSQARPGGACLWSQHLEDGSWRVSSARPDSATEVTLKPAWASLDPDSNKQAKHSKKRRRLPKLSWDLSSGIMVPEM